MVQLSPSLNLTPTPDLHNHGESPLDLTVDQLTGGHMTGPKEGKDEGERASEQTEVYPGYEGYIENGLICLKHKVRNLEKKKLKLEEYKLKLKRGHLLNKDQVASVEKYEEVLHHLSLAQELHQTLDSLSQNLLRAQKKAVKRQQMQSRELERRRLCSVLQFQQVLQSLNRDDVQSDLISGLNQAPQVPAQTLQCLRELRPLLGLTWDHALSVGEQMLRAAGLFMDLLDGKDAPVADSTFASLKEELCVLVHSPYFNSLPPQAEQSDKNYRDPNKDTSNFELPKSTRPEKPQPCSDPVWTWDSDCGALKSQEPPDHWDSRCTDQAPGESPTVGKRWRGGAALVPKNQPGVRRPEEGKRKERKARREEPLKPCVDLHMPVEVLTLPTDPELRRQRLEELLMNINGAFSFVQDSVLDGDCSPSSARHGLRRASGCPSPLAQSDLRSLGDPLPLQSTPLSGRWRDPKTSLTNGDHTLGSQDMELVSCCDTLLSYIETSVSAVCHKPSAQSPVPVKPPLSHTPPMPQSFTTPPSRRALSPAHFSNMPTVFKVNPSLPPTDFSQTEHRPRIRSISTQTPPEFDTRDEESHEAGWSDMSLVSSIELGPRDSALDSGHGATSSASDLTSSGLVDAPLLPHAPPEAPPSAPLLPLYRVAFTALRTVNFAPGNLDQPIVFDQLHSNVGEMYDPHIGNFTCPVDGTYVFLFHILKLATYVPLYVNLMRNEEVIVSAYANDDAPDHETASNHAILPLFRGDQVWLRLHRGAIYGSTWKYSTFSGFLLYQD